MTDLIFSSYKVGSLALSNRVVMAPMTRNRAMGNIPNELMAHYYAQRAGAGLIISEGTAPSPNGLGYANIPAIYNEAQVEGWKKTTDAVHGKGGKIFVQLMHTGRMGNPGNLPAGAELLAPSAIPAMGRALKNTQRTAEYYVPKAMTLEDIQKTQDEFVHASKYAIDAGFDGVELHGANEHIIEQFLSFVSNQRTDEYGGTIENRSRFALETIAKVGNAVGFDRVAIRLSPYGANSWIHPEDTDAVFDYLTRELNTFGLAYLHHADHSAMGGNEVPLHIKQLIRNNFKGTILLTGGFNQQSAEETLQSGLADLAGFGRMFISNPDLVERMKNNREINTIVDSTTFYTSGAKGYTDYQTYK
jgi:N-ethylmaleimide reductase